MTGKSIVLLTVKPPGKSFLPVEEKRIPLDIATLMAYLKEQNLKITLVDNFLKYNEWENIIEELSPDFVGLYLSPDTWANAKKYLNQLNLLRTEEPKLQFKIIAFGPLLSLTSENLPEFVDFIIKGVPYQAFNNIIQEQITDKCVEGIVPDNEDDMKFPYLEYFIPDGHPLDSEYDFTSQYLGESFPVFDINAVFPPLQVCAKCYENSITDQSLHRFSANRLFESIQYLVNTYQAKGIIFKDPDFTADIDRVIALCDSLIESGLDLSWSCTIKPGFISAETIHKMKSAGCVNARIPLNSATQQLLEYIDAGFTVHQARELSHLLKETGISQTICITYGIPIETEADRQQTDNLLEELKPDFIERNIFVGIQNSRFYEDSINFPHRVDENGLVIPYQWESLAKKYLGKANYSGDYSDALFASNPIQEVIFYKKKNYIEEQIDFIDSLPLNKKIYFFGATDMAKALIKKYKLEESNIKGFFDADLSRSGRFRPTKFTIYHETEIKKLAPDYIFISLADKEESIKVKKSIINSHELVKKPDVVSLFYQEV